MTLTPEDLSAIKAMLVAVQSEHKCRFSIDDDEAKEIPHAVGMIGDLGGGDIRAGVEIVRENHKFISTMRNTVSRFAMVVGGAVATAVVGGVCAALWLGFRVLAAFKGGQP
jgi:hypothetical protein